MYRPKSQAWFVLTLLAGFVLFAGLFLVALTLLKSETGPSRAPLLLTVFIVILVLSIFLVFMLLRWLLRPYRQLVGEAERAPVALGSNKPRDEGQFVLETFKSVVAQLQSQQRELEALSAQARARAASAEKFSERIVASVPSALIAFDSTGHATVVNAPARALIEADGEAEGQSVRALLKASPDLAEMVEHCLQTGDVFRREEILATARSGQQRRLGATVAPIELETEKDARGALCLVTDLTEVSQLREQVALKRNLESLGEMSAGLAHEFKNALAALHGYAQLMQKLELDERGQTASTALLQEVRNLSEMVTSFLNFARPQPLDLTEVSLRELLDECAQELRPLAEEKNVELKIEGEFTEVRADERMLRQALLNILRNAIEATSESEGKHWQVIVRGGRQSDTSGKSWATVEVQDTGAGIQPGDLQRIFIPFFTTKSKGHGVGLALAHRVVIDHGGTLTAANSPAGGAVFTIKLPLS
ncbi:MAG TPA: ATP-binding protein [Pyrinomonadaceae bacterium]